MNNQWQKGTWTKSRGNSGAGTYYPRRPVKSFQDLEVYQRLLAASVAVVKRLRPLVIASPKRSEGRGDLDGIATATAPPRNDMAVKLAVIALDLPVKVATAHSIRFSDQLKAIQTLEEAMLDCNILVVYLEQYRDIDLPAAELARSLESRSQCPQGVAPTIEPEFFEEQIKNLLITRMKILHLQMSWKKFLAIRQKEQNV